jgi:hypothetical protein
VTVPLLPSGPRDLLVGEQLLRNPVGNVGHRRYRPLFREGSRRPIGFEQHRPLFDATHKDDKGKWMCDECCQRCTTCKAGTTATTPRLIASRVLSDSAYIRTVAENNPSFAELHGISVTAAS